MMAFRTLPTDTEVVHSRAARAIFYLELSRSESIGKEESRRLVSLARGLQKQGIEEKVDEYSKTPERMDVAINIMVTAIKEFKDDTRFQASICRRIIAIRDEPIFHEILSAVMARDYPREAQAEELKAASLCVSLFEQSMKVEYIEIAVRIEKEILRNGARAHEIVDNAITLLPDNHTFRELKAELLESEGDWIGASESYKDAIRCCSEAMESVQTAPELLMWELQIRQIIRKLKVTVELAAREYQKAHAAAGQQSPT